MEQERIERLTRMIVTTLVNDEGSTDNQLVEYFIRLGADKKVARNWVSLRSLMMGKVL